MVSRKGRKEVSRNVRKERGYRKKRKNEKRKQKYTQGMEVQWDKLGINQGREGGRREYHDKKRVVSCFNGLHS